MICTCDGASQRARCQTAIKFGWPMTWLGSRGWVPGPKCSGPPNVHAPRRIVIRCMGMGWGSVAFGCMHRDAELAVVDAGPDPVAGPSAAAHVANLEWMRPARPRGGAPPRPYSLHPRRAGIWIWPPDSSARLSTRCGAPRARRHWRCRGHRSSRCPAAADHRARRQRVAQLRAPVHAGRLRPPEARAAQHSTAAAAARAAAAMDGDREPLRRVG